MGKWLTYGIPARNRVLVECLGGLFFNGRRSCTEDSFAGHLGLCFGDFLTVSIVNTYPSNDIVTLAMVCALL